MKKNYFENIDPRPKRKMHRDNPYRIFSIGCNTEKPHYYVKFLDNLGVEICLEISKELFDFFDGCELKDLSFINEIDRHAAKIELTPYLLGAISDESVEPMFDCIAKKQKVKALRVAIMILPDKQRRRLLMYYAWLSGETEGRLPRLLFSLPSGIDFRYSVSPRWAMPTPAI